MRSIPLLLCVFCVCMPFEAYAKSAMDVCFEYYRTQEKQLLDCMNKRYEKRENIRLMIEDDIIVIVKKHQNENYNITRKNKDLDSLARGREMFEEYRKLECNRQKKFLARNGPQATFEYMACLFDMTNQRIHALQSSVNN